MRRLLKTVLTLLLIGLLASCDHQALIDKFTPQEQAGQARKLFEQLSQRDFEAVEQQADPEVRAGFERAKLEQVAAVIPAAAPLKVKTIGAHTLFTNDMTTYQLSFEYQYPDSWLQVYVELRQREGKTWLYGMHINSSQESLETAHQFGFEGKGVRHYAMFALALVMPTFVLFALVQCIRTPIAQRKWLWIMFILFGFTNLTLNWTTGEWGFVPLYVGLFCVAAAKAAPAAPLFLGVSFPLGAILFLARRQELAAAAAAARQDVGS